jgi:DNA polymerase-4
MRTILHSDLNNFYASVEQLRYPELARVPMAVVGDAEARHGIILAKNYPAKALGIKTGQVIWEAKLLCRGLVTIPADFPTYYAFSQRVKAIYGDYTDQIESFGIDECWLDVTGSLRLFEKDGKAIADEIRERVKRELGLTVSIGVSWNKIFAKIGSELKKPDAVTVITPENYKRIIWTLPAADLLYVGKATNGKLAKLGIRTIGDIAQANGGLLRARLGKWGDYLKMFANGIDIGPVTNIIPFKSVGNSFTNYRDMQTEDEVRLFVYLLAESVMSRCRDLGIYKIQEVSISVIDSSLEHFSRQIKLEFPTLLVGEVVEAAMRLFRASYTWQRPVRGMGLSVSRLMTPAADQTNIMRDEKLYDKHDRAESAVERIRKKYGNLSIRRALILSDARLSQKDIKGENIIHPEALFKF